MVTTSTAGCGRPDFGLSMDKVAALYRVLTFLRATTPLGAAQRIMAVYGDAHSLKLEHSQQEMNDVTLQLRGVDL